MTVSISTLAQQALRLLGVRIVPLDDSPTLTEMVPVANIATAALIEMGVLNSDGTPYVGTVPIAEIAEVALAELGVLNSNDPLPIQPHAAYTDIITAALVELNVLNSNLVPDTGIMAEGDIATAALQELGVIASDEFASDADGTLALSKVGSVHANLLAKGIAKWSIFAIPRGVAEEYTKLTAAEMASSFGKTADPALVMMLEARILAIAQVMTTNTTVVTNHLTAVHYSLVNQGIALWDIYNIPQSFFEEYTKLTVAVASASFGKPTDPAVVAMLEDRVRKGSMVLNNNVNYMLTLASDVHASLVGHGIAKWDIGAIPRSFAEDYTKLTVAYAAGSFGKAVDPASIALFEEHIRQGAMVLSAGSAYVLDKIASVHAALDAQGVVWWTGSAVPRAFVEEYTQLAIAYTATALGKKIDLAIVPALEARIRKGAMVLSADDNAIQAVQAVHDDLTMRGIARWTVFDIPNAVGTSYVTLAADALGPLFDVRTDPNAARDAMTALYRYVTLPSSGELTPAVYF